jgi:hypothetical protein
MVWSCRDGPLTRPSRATLGWLSPVATNAARHLPAPFPLWNSPAHYLRRLTLVPSHPPPKDYTRDYEAPLHHRTHQGRDEVYLLALRPPRQHPRLRSPRRQPPHSGSYRHQPARHQGPSRTRNVLLPRRPTTHLARLNSPQILPLKYCRSDRSQALATAWRRNLLIAGVVSSP